MVCVQVIYNTMSEGEGLVKMFACTVWDNWLRGTLEWGAAHTRVKRPLTQAAEAEKNKSFRLHY